MPAACIAISRTRRHSRGRRNKGKRERTPAARETRARPEDGGNRFRETDERDLSENARSIGAISILRAPRVYSVETFLLSAYRAEKP